MTEPPVQPKIYHITHVDNLARIIAQGELLPDSKLQPADSPHAAIGMPGIKARRLELPVECHQGDYVGEYVPFYFCPRSIMLYVIYRQNHPDLEYRGGQGPIVHMEADLHRVIRWAEDLNRRWAFSLSNAGTRYATFRKRAGDLDQLNWNAIAARDFRSADISEGKQAEFLVRDSFPWTLVDRIGVKSTSIRDQTDEIIAEAEHRPQTNVLLDWYY